jgi:hypothetical protein
MRVVLVVAMCSTRCQTCTLSQVGALAYSVPPCPKAYGPVSEGAHVRVLGPQAPPSWPACPGKLSKVWYAAVPAVRSLAGIGSGGVVSLSTVPQSCCAVDRWRTRPALADFVTTFSASKRRVLLTSGCRCQASAPSPGRRLRRFGRVSAPVPPAGAAELPCRWPTWREAGSALWSRHTSPNREPS